MSWLECQPPWKGRACHYAVYEILFDDTIPGSVSINEAVELAKKYGAQESPAFINGVLAKFVPKTENS